MDKLISIALPAYNAGDYIGECLDNLLAQTYPNFEIILIDDCSTDHTAQVVAGYKDSRIRYFKNEKNLGIVHTLNKAYGLCKGEYIARMDADDTCKPDRLEKQLAILEANPEIGMVACDLQMFGARSGIIHYSTDPEQIRCRLLFSLQLGHNAWLFRRELLDIHHLAYREEYRYAEDWDFIVRASRITKFSNVPQPLTGYRMFPQQSSQLHRKEQLAAADRVARDQLDYLGATLTEEEFALYRKAFGKGEVLLHRKEAETLLRITKKLEQANAVKKFYDPGALRRVIRQELFATGYFNLMNRRKSGLPLTAGDMRKAQKLSAVMGLKLWLRRAATWLTGKEEA